MENSLKDFPQGTDMIMLIFLEDGLAAIWKLSKNVHRQLSKREVRAPGEQEGEDEPLRGCHGLLYILDPKSCVFPTGSCSAGHVHREPLRQG